jgi:tetratricopeptide (TPR) repeat protein
LQKTAIAATNAARLKNLLLATNMSIGRTRIPCGTGALRYHSAMLRELLRGIFKRSDDPIERNGIEVARDLYREGQYDEAINLLTTLVDYKPDWVEAILLLGTAKHASGRTAEGLADMTRAHSLAPNDAACCYELAFAHHKSGNDEAALEFCRQALQAAPTDAEPRWLQSKILLKGEDYLTLLARIHGYLRPRTYVEIGVFKGESLRLALPTTQAIGIDPEPQLAASLGTGQQLFAKTSDAFFAGHDLAVELGGLPVDLAFIDGIHHFEFALRDFINLERYCTSDSTILIHDCYPLDAYSARRDGAPPFWTGDVWRLIVLLKNARPDLTVRVVGAPPTGLGIVRGLDSGSRVLSGRFDELIREYQALDFSYLTEEKAAKLNVVPNEWEDVRKLLGDSRFSALRH